jgi:hypothetical protein
MSHNGKHIYHHWQKVEWYTDEVTAQNLNKKGDKTTESPGE